MWGAYWLVTISEVVVGFELLIHVFSSILKTAESSVGFQCYMELQAFTPVLLVAQKSKDGERNSHEPLNHPLLLFAIQGSPIETIRQLQYKQTACHSAGEQDRPVCSYKLFSLAV